MPSTATERFKARFANVVERVCVLEELAATQAQRIAELEALTETQARRLAEANGTSPETPKAANG